MKIFSLITIVLTSVLLFGCTKSIDEDQLLKRNGIAYEVNSNKPFTGKVTSSSNILDMKTETYYRDGIEHGTQTAWYRNGNKGMEMEMFNGKAHGRFIAWFENGQKKVQTEFKNGKKHNTETEWDEDGQIRLQKVYRKGKLHGTYLKWYKNGAKQLQIDYELGVMHGNWITWYESSQKKEHRVYVNGLRHGKHISWYNNGQKKFEQVFANGKQQGGLEQWDRVGNKRVAKSELASQKTNRLAIKQKPQKKELGPLANFFGAIFELAMAEKNARKKRYERLGTTNPRQPPKGPWKGRYWCWTDFHNQDAVNPTFCTDKSGGVWQRGGLTDPCGGAEGWCDGYGLGPKPGFNQ